MKTFTTPKGNQSKDYSGQRFGKLTVLRYLRTEYVMSGNRHSADANHIFECLCDCGNLCDKSLRNIKISTQCPPCSFKIKNQKLSKPRGKIRNQIQKESCQVS